MGQRKRNKPIIGIAGDVDLAGGGDANAPPALRSCCRMTYVDAIVAAGGCPLVLPPVPEQIENQLSMVDGVVLIGGDDPRTEPFGEPTDPRAPLVEDRRQRYDVALLEALQRHERLPVLGVCYGMQMMALVAGGRLDQHLPDTLGPGGEAHWQRPHGIEARQGSPQWLQEAAGETPLSRHRQAVASPGGLSVAGEGPGGVIEAVHDPARAFYVGVQWHPERSGNGKLGLGVYSVLVRACGGQDGPASNALPRRIDRTTSGN